jgi:curved DNA-binding protein CbpA
MPPRPSLILRSIASRPIPSPWTCHTCLQRTLPRRIQSRTSNQQTSSFHTTPPRFADAIPNHYETLHVQHTATSAEIKRQFYALSKKNHPDHNRNDPEASTRFVAISEAYHILSVPDKRAQYDAQLEHSQRQSRWGKSGREHPQGSHHSSAVYGARPASGLNKKRSTFRGPPPSFYKAGGYGHHGAKRAEYAYHHAHEGREGGEGGKAAGSESYGEWGGFGPGQQKHGNEVPHFDNRRHKETHDNVNEHIWARRRGPRPRVRAEEEWERGNMVVNFVMVSSVIAMIGVTAKLFGDRNEANNRAKGNV